MEVLRILRSLRRNWVALTILCLSAGIAGFYFTFLLEERYEATALVIVHPEDEFSISDGVEQKELLNLPISSGQTTIETPLNTYIAIVESRVMATRVVEKFGLEYILSKNEKKETKEDESAFFTALQDWLEPYSSALGTFVSNSIDYLLYGRVLETSSDYEKAVKEYLENISLNAIKDTQLFEVTYSGLDPYRAAAISSATADLFLDYVAEMNTAEEKVTLQFMGQQMRQARREFDEAVRKLRMFKEQSDLIDFTSENEEEIRLISDLQRDLETIEARLFGLLKKNLPSSPEVVALQAEKDHLSATLAERRRKLYARTEIEAQLVALELEVATTRTTYQTLQEEYEESRVLHAKRVSEMRVVSPAVPSNSPARPIRVVYAVSAAFVALLFGIYAVGIRELMNTAIRNVDDVERVLQLPVLATIPRTRRQLVRPH